jgi:hypothetical protein
MIISEHIMSIENGTEYYKINFTICNDYDITAKQYEEIETMIYNKLIQLQKENGNKRLGMVE